MARNTDYIPNADHAFFRFQKILLKQLAANALRWHIPAEEVDLLKNTAFAYEESYWLKTEPATRSQKHVQLHRSRRLEYEKQLRRFIMFWLYYNTRLTAFDRSAISLPAPKEKYSRRPRIADAPVVHVRCSGHGRLHFVCRTSVATKPAMHSSARALEVRYTTTRSGPKIVTSCKKTHNSSRSKFTLTLPQGNAGKFFYCCLRWLHYSDEKKNSPWTGMIELVVT